MKSDILYGKRIVMDMLSKSPSKIEIVWIQKTRYKDVNEILKSCQNNKVKYQFVPKEKLDRICPKKHQGIRGLFKQNCSLLSGKPRIT